MYFPDDLWKIIKDYQIDHKKHHHRKLKLCHKEIFSDHRPVYYKKVTGDFHQGWGIIQHGLILVNKIMKFLVGQTTD